MTAQVSDSVVYQNQKFSIIALSKPFPFQPADYGLRPISRSSACWNGFWCMYEIQEDQLLLQEFMVNMKDQMYPDIHEVQAQSPKGNQNMGHHQYRNLLLPVDYTGAMLVGNLFLSDFYIPMGYERAWTYETLIELIFDHGSVVDVIDHSLQAACMRERIKEQPSLTCHELIEQTDGTKFGFLKNRIEHPWWMQKETRGVK